MRIRKRQVPFPLSSLTPVPLSDPQINRSPVVQLDHLDSTTTQSSHPHGDDDAGTTITSPLDSQPSDQQLTPIGKPSNDWDSSSSSGAHKEKKEDCLGVMQREDGRGEEVAEKSTNDSTSRKGSSLVSEIATAVLLLSSPSHQDGRWCEGEKAIPLKKRRGMMEENSKKVKTTRMKTKMNKKCSVLQNDNNEQDEEEETKVGGIANNNASKKKARGSALMEGSRCSRVNGRGWRCCQQTLVGYSLCEHHLGKGRMRSMTSVRSRSVISSSTKESASASDPLLLGRSSLHIDNQTKTKQLDYNDDDDDNEDDDDHDEDEKQPLMMTKKRMKLGMVKARSLSSLLGQNQQ
ncbi:Growth-regulating factor [Quillaja saponaria]|uniref:Growth-regulating factor n=1 Tax=Quillaja saponaria TaxID=32244 RepID=A0AAD7Q707_QUISA|nr:Growth-regulating factor [Quillaja saponaria]